MPKPTSRHALFASTILGAGLLLAAAPARAQDLPDTGNVTSATAGLSGGAAGSTNPGFSITGTAGAQTLRVDLKDNRTILTWRGTGFDIAAGNTVDFKDSRASGGVTGRTDNIAVLNRDLSNTNASIYGTLRSDPNIAVYVIDRYGITFGPSSVTNTGALFASTLDLTDSNFVNKPFSLDFTGDAANIELHPGARITTTATNSTDGGRLGDLVLIGTRVNGSENGDLPVLKAIGGDVALIAASAVTIQNSPGSPLSFNLETGGQYFLPSKVIDLVANITGSNVTVATLRRASALPGQTIALGGSITATGAAVTDRGVVLTAGKDAPGVTVNTNGATTDVDPMELNASVMSAKNITVKYASNINIYSPLQAAGTIDLYGTALDGHTATITGGQVVVPGDLRMSGKITATNGDLTLRPSSDGSVSLAAGAQAFGGISGEVGSFSTGDLVAGGAIDLTISDGHFSNIRADGPISIVANGFALSFTGDVVSGSDITASSSFRSLSGHDFTGGGVVSLTAVSNVTANDVYGGKGVSLITDGFSDRDGLFDDGRLRIGNVSTGDAGDLYIRALQLFSGTDGRVDSLSAGRNIEIRTAFIDAASIKATNGSVKLTADLPSRTYGNYINVDHLAAGTTLSAGGLGGIQLIDASTRTGDMTLRGTYVFFGSTATLSNSFIGGDLKIMSDGTAQVRSGVVAGGNIDVSGTNVVVGNGMAGNEIHARGAIDLTGTTSSVRGLSGVLVQSNSDGVGSEAITISSATNVVFSSDTTLLGGTNRQSDVRIRSAEDSFVALGNLSARSLLGATISNLFANGITRNSDIYLRGDISLTNTLHAQGTSLTVLGALGVSSGDIDLRSGDELTIGTALTASGVIAVRTSAGDLTVDTAGSFTGRNIVLSTPGAFVNNGGAAIMNAAGHWVVYSADPAGDTFGGLDSGNTALWNATLATRDPSTVSGNRYVFALQPTLTFATQDLSKVYGTDLTGAVVPFGVTGYQPGVAGAYLADTAATAYAGLPAITSAGFATRAAVAGGPYATSIATGTLTSDAGYGFAFANPGMVTITPKALTGTASVADKTYDGTTMASGSVVLDGVVAGDSVGTAGTSYMFADKNAGAGRTVTVAGTMLTGADAGNYSFTIPATALADILAKALAVSVTADSKTYDGTTAGTGSVTISGAIAGDAVAAGGTTFTFVDKNAGTGKPVTVAGTTLTGADAGDYSFTIPATALADIFRKALALNVTANSKTYDGTTTATGSATLRGVVAGDTVAASGTRFAFADKNAGTAKTVNVTGTALTGADAGNYSVTLPGSVLADILKAALTASVTANSKTYDGTTAGSGSVTLNGAVAGDAVRASGTTFTFADRNAGTGKTVTVAGTTLTGADAGNYSFTVPATALADIFKAALTASVTADSKTYDGTTAGTGSVMLNGAVAGDAVAAGGTTFTFVDKNAGTGKMVAVAGTTLTGADAGNYSFTIPATALADILQKALALNVTADSKTYDGTTAGTGSVTLTGAVAGDTVGTSGTTFTFADRNAGAGKTVNVAGTALTGADAGNYRFTIPATALADVLQKALALNVTADSKTYDGTTAATGSATLSGVVGGDKVAASGTSFAFADKNAGTGKLVDVRGTTLTGADAANYRVTLPAAVMADIFKAALTASVTANDKTYDGTTAGTGSVVLHGAIAGDAVGTGGTTFTFADKNAGSGKTVTVAGTALTGTDAGNYSFTIPAAAMADILNKALIAAVSVNDKVYDGTTAASGTIALNGVVAGETVGTGTPTFAFADRNAGTGKVVRVAGAALTGADAVNYTLGPVAGGTATISPRALAIIADDLSKIAGAADPTLTYRVNGELVGGDMLSGALLRAAGEAPRGYAIEQGTLSAGSNYAITYTPGVFTIGLNPATTQQQTLRALVLPAQVQAPQGLSSGLTLAVADLCGDDVRCVAR